MAEDQYPAVVTGRTLPGKYHPPWGNRSATLANYLQSEHATIALFLNKSTDPTCIFRNNTYFLLMSMIQDIHLTNLRVPCLNQPPPSSDSTSHLTGIPNPSSDKYHCSTIISEYTSIMFSNSQSFNTGASSPTKWKITFIHENLLGQGRSQGSIGLHSKSLTSQFLLSWNPV